MCAFVRELGVVDVCVLCVALSCVFLFYLVLLNNTTSYLWYAASCEIFVKTVGCLFMFLSFMLPFLCVGGGTK